jgi:hypothetical protein
VNGRRRVLVLYRTHDPHPLRVAVARHLHVLEHTRSPFDVFYYDAQHRVPGWLRGLGIHAVILHPTFLGMRWSELFPLWKRKTAWLGDLQCPKIALPQDDYDGSEILDDWLFELGVTDVFSVFGDDKRALLYPLMHERARFHKCLTGYIDDAVAAQCRERLAPLSERPLDLVYRAARLPYRFGRQGQLKHDVGTVVGDRAPWHGLSCDISTRPADAIFGEAWLDFLMSGRAVIGCESGASALDRRGEIQAAIDSMLQQQPSLSFAEVSARLPAGWDDYEFFTVGPRHFEAVITQTAQVLVEGRYDGILEPNRHYLPLRRDFSNLDEVLERVKDRELLDELVEQAYEDVYLSGAYSYRRFAAQLEAVLDEAGPVQLVVGAGPPVAWPVAERAVALERALDARRPQFIGRFLASPRSTLTKGLAAVRLTLSSPRTRRLLLDYLGNRDVRRQISPQNVIADLIRLDLLRRRSADSMRFAVTPLLEDDGRRLLLRSRAHDVRADADTAELTQIEVALRAGRIEAIVWDHSDVGDEVVLPGAGGRRIKVGHAYPFQALVVLGRRFPDHAADALSPILRPNGVTGGLKKA